MSIFSVSKSLEEISPKFGMKDYRYEQVASLRDATGSNFPNGNINFRFQVSGSKWWIPSKSYIRCRVLLTKQDGATILSSEDNIAPNMNMLANMFQNAEFRIAGKTISRLDDNIAQIDMLENRLNKSGGWLDSVGASTNFTQSRVADRIRQVSTDGVEEKYQNDLKTVKADLGFDPTDDYAMTSATGVITFSDGAAGAPAVTVSDVFSVGDYFQPLAGVFLGAKYKIVATSATTITVAPGPTADTAGATTGFQRISGSPNSRRTKYFELIWQPSLSIMKIPHALPAGNYELVLTPHPSSSYKLRAIESLIANKVAGTDFELSVQDLYLQNATVEGPRVDNIEYYIDLDNTRCQSDNVDNNTSLQQKNFDVSPSTKALTLAFQDSRAGSNTLYSQSKFKVNGSLELGLNRMFISYNGLSLPSPDADPSYVTGTNTDYTAQRYAENLLNSGAWFSDGKAEDIQDWHERGAYYYFNWPKDANDRSTRVQVHYAFTTALGDNGRVLLFDHSKSIAHVQVKDGLVVDARVQDA